MLTRKWWTLLATCIGVFMLLLDLTVVTVALPSMQRSLGASFDDLQWVVNAYALTLAAFLLTAGVLADRYGRKRLFLAGLGVFTLASLGCAVSTSALALYVARAVQGFGDAFMFAASLALLADAFRGNDRGLAFGIFGAVTGAAAALGPLVGGAITSSLGWRWIFYLNLPLGLVGALVAVAFVRESRDPAARRIDWAGCLAFSGALFLLVLALVRGNADGWRSSSVVALFAGAALLTGAFVAIEWWQRQPALDLALFRRPAVTGVTLVAFSVSASLLATLLYVTLYLQDALGLSPFAVGVRLLPVTLLAFAVAPAASVAAVRLPPRAVLGVGQALVAGGLALMATSGTDPGWIQLLPGLAACGAGIGVVNPVLNATAVRVVPVERSGLASGINTTFRQLGIAVGVAALGAVFQSRLTAGVLSHLQEAPGGLATAREHPAALATILHTGAPPSTTGPDQLLAEAYRSGFAGTLHDLAAIAAVVAALGAVAAVTLVRQRDLLPDPAPLLARGGPESVRPAPVRRLQRPAPVRRLQGAPPRQAGVGAPVLDPVVASVGGPLHRRPRGRQRSPAPTGRVPRGEAAPS